MLTKRQRKVLVFVEGYQRELGISPSFAEITTAIGSRSKSNVYEVLNALEERGFIRRLGNRARAIEILRSADGNYREKPGPTPTSRDVLIPKTGKTPKSLTNVTLRGVRLP